MPENKAAWLTSKQAHPFVIDTAPMPNSGDWSLTIGVRAVAFNPVDHMIQKAGVILDKFPAIVGCDASGEVVAVGSKITGFKEGDRVIGLCDPAEPGENEGKGVFQWYANVDARMSAKLPNNVDFKSGAVLPMGICVASVALFERRCLGLVYPKLEPVDTGKTILVWGGGSSMGSCGIQLAKAAGYRVAATASAHNLDYLKTLGAEWAFDYKSESVVRDVVAALKGQGEFAGVFVAVMGTEVFMKSAEIGTQLGGKQVIASVLPPFMPFTEPLPGDVKVAYSECILCIWSYHEYLLTYERDYGTWLKDSAVGPAVWGDFVTPALEMGVLMCKPDAQVVGKGLEKIQEANDKLGGTVSATTFVVELP